MRVPIRLRQSPALAWQLLRRSLVLRRPLPRQPTFRICYFSCESYFRYLYCSVHSLKRHAGDVRYEVLVFNDNDMPISATQIAALQALLPGLRVIPWPKSMGWGATQIACIWQAYAVAAKGAAAGDVVVRVDSDVFFFNNRIFKAVERSDADVVGDGHFVDFAYCQGGCYFFRVAAVQRVLGYLAACSLADDLAQAGITVEDIAADHFARRLGLRIWKTWFMMFPDELRNAGGLTPWQRLKFSCLHFVMKNKSAMIDAYLAEQLPPAEHARFLALLKTA